MTAAALADQGFAVFPFDPRVMAWAQAAHRAGRQVADDPDLKRQWLRHDGTWFVGVDALPTAPDGSINGVPFAGAWMQAVTPPHLWHRGQLSVTYAGYPRRGVEDTEQSHRYRSGRAAAHVDGLRLEDGRRYPREPHAFVVGFALNDTEACPLMVWPGSHLQIGAALRDVIKDGDPRTVDVTEAYTSARRQVFKTIEPQPLLVKPGEAMVLHRHLLHGIAPHDPSVSIPPEGRMMAYFRPECENPYDWI